MSTLVKTTLVGLAIGLLIAFGSFTQVLVVALCTGIGAAIGLVLDGRVDLSDVLKRRDR